MSAPAYISVCPICAERLSKGRVTVEVSEEFIGYCALCRTKTAIMQYEVGPRHDELERRRRKARAEDKKRKPASGERGRAERRSNA